MILVYLCTRNQEQRIEAVVEMGVVDILIFSV